ncbi:MAG: hypothetical protein ACI8RZ_007171 [Myxococcota bacterium]|jgi:hypothetical protein
MLPALLLLSGTDALAGSGPHMWGAGPTLSTIAWPGAYPNSFPKSTQDGDPNPRDHLEGVKGDAGLAARGLIYLNNQNRIGARLNLGFGGGYRATTFTIEYEKSILREDNINVFVGGGIGVGRLKFSQGTEGGVLSTNTYNTRLQISAIYRDKQGKKNAPDDRAYEVAIFASPIGFNGPETYEYGNVTVQDPDNASAFAFLSSDEGDNQKLNGSLYNPTLGIEVSVLFGDFTSPKKKKNNR